MLATIPWMSTEWSISFECRMTGLKSFWTSIIHFTIGGDNDQIGDRIPAVFWSPLQLLLFASAVNDTTDNYEIAIQLNRVYKIEVHQRYISNGNYRYFIEIDGEEVHSVNTKARQFYNVLVYTSNPWYDASPGDISNFKFTNFL